MDLEQVVVDAIMKSMSIRLDVLNRRHVVAAPVPTCNPADVSVWLIAAALGPLLVFVGVAFYVNGHTKLLNAGAKSGHG